MHTVPAANGEPRATMLRDARKLRLLPSVSNVLGVINKPELVEWKMTQAVLAALTLPRLDGEGEDAFAKRVVEDVQSRVRTAVDFGSAFHAGAEQIAKTLEVDPAGPYAAWLNLHRDWFQANCIRVLWTERVLVNTDLGYAGTAYLLVEHQEHGLTLVDYKTQGVKEGKTARVVLLCRRADSSTFSINSERRSASSSLMFRSSRWVSTSQWVSWGAGWCCIP